MGLMMLLERIVVWCVLRLSLISPTVADAAVGGVVTQVLLATKGSARNAEINETGVKDTKLFLPKRVFGELGRRREIQISHDQNADGSDGSCLLLLLRLKGRHER